MLCFSIPFLQSSMPTTKANLLMVYASLSSNFGLQPSTPGFSWYFVLDLLRCPCTSHNNIQLWSCKPSLEHRKINGSLLQRFLAALAMHLADKRPFSPASLDAHLAFRCWQGVCGLSALFPPSLLSLVQIPQFSSLFWVFLWPLTDTHAIPFTNQEIFLSWILQTFRDQSYFFFLNLFSFQIHGKGIIPSVIVSQKMI